MPTICAVFYETAGTIGPITAVKLIDSVGENLSFFLSPVSLALAAIMWSFIRPTGSQDELALPEDLAVEKAIPHTPVREPSGFKRYKAPYINPRRALIPIQTLTTSRLLVSFDLEWRCHCAWQPPIHLAYPLLLICTSCAPVRQSCFECQSVKVIP